MSTLDPLELEAAVRALLSQNQKIAAVKLYREETGLGLRESKEAVEACERGGPLPHPARPANTMRTAGPPPAAGSYEAQVLEHLHAGRKIEAIKAYRQATGESLKQAKEAVEELARRNGIEASGGGCLGVLALAVGLTSLRVTSLAAALWALT